MKPQDFFTLKGLPTPMLLTISKAPILNEQLIMIDIANVNSLLGEPVLSLTTNKGEFTQFKTVDNTLLWVEKKHTTILLNA
jgi:Fe2+ transport system protein B